MSGHSKWATIKHKKAKTDAQRGKMFTKFIREISVAARMGGGDPAVNPRLRLAVERAREVNMPSDNIKRAIAKGTGGGEEVKLEEIVYEGYGPGGVAVMVEAMTDNKNRTLGDLNYIFTRNGGHLGKSGCVAWLFKKRGVITFERGKVDEEKLTSEAIEAGAEDINFEESVIAVITKPEDMEKVRDQLKSKGFTLVSAEVTMFPQNTVILVGEEAHKVLKLVSVLEEHDDVQTVHANFDIPDEIIAEEATS